MKRPPDPRSSNASEYLDVKAELIAATLSIAAALAGLSLFHFLGPYDTQGLSLTSATRWLGVILGLVGLYGLCESLLRLAIVAVAIAVSGYWPVFVLLAVPVLLLGGLIFYTAVLLTG